jgi:4-amino-4-deoxy-L-arabinose transferase
VENVYQGIVVILFCCIGYCLAYKASRSSKYTLALSCIMICGLVLRIYTSADFYLHAWDERFHALVAKNMLKHFFVPTLYDNPVLPYKYTSWSDNHIWLHKQPLTLWLIAVSLKCFGVNEFAVRVPSIILSTIAIKLMYDIGSFFADKSTGLLSAFLLSANGLIIELAAGRDATDHVDVVFMFFILLGVWCAMQYAKRGNRIYLALIGVSIGLGILTKWLPALIVLPIALLLLRYYKKGTWQIVAIDLLVICVCAACVAVPWQLYILHTFPKEAMWEYAFNRKHISQVLEGHGGNFFYYFNELRIRYGELVYLPIAWHTIESVKKVNTISIVICIWFWTVFLFFSFAQTKMPAFTMIAAPAIFFMTAKFFYYLKEKTYNYPKFKFVWYIIMFGLIALPVRYAIERVKPFEKINRHPEWTKTLKDMRNTTFDRENVVLFNCTHPIEAMFYLKCTAYSIVPDIETEKMLERKGYAVAIMK